MSLKLHVFPPSPRAFKVQAAANHLGLDYELCFVNFAKGDHKRPEFLALNSNGKMPVLEEDGFALWESNAILNYLAGKKPGSGLLPSDERGRADVMRWQFWEAAHWDPACAILIYEHYVKPRFGMGEADPAEVAKGEERFHQFAKVLDAHLKGRKYICGDKLSAADFSIGAPLIVAEQVKLPLAPYAEIKRWYAGLAALPCWQKTLAGIATAG